MSGDERRAVMVPAYTVTGFAVDRHFPDDTGPSVKIGFVQAGSDGQLILTMSEPLAWWLASALLQLLDRDPMDAETMRELEP